MLDDLVERGTYAEMKGLAEDRLRWGGTVKPAEMN